MGIASKILGHPRVYDTVQALLCLGLQFDETYAWLEAHTEDVVVDVGCGNGHALEYFRDFSSYHGFDVDERATAALKNKFPGRRIDVSPEALTAAHMMALRPNKAIAMSLLHHLDDTEVAGLLDVLASSGTVRRIITLDTVYLSGKPINNVVAFADRGRHTRTREAYLALLEDSPFRVIEEDLSNTRTRNTLLYYYSMCLAPRSV